MLFVLIPLLTAGLTSGSGAPHIPHAVVRDIAFRPLPGGRMEMVTATNWESKILRSFDEGLSWEPLAGEGLDRFEPSRVEYWDDPVRPRFFIGTEGGMWTYDPNSGDVRNVNAGLFPGDLLIVEISTADNGLGPVLIATEGGRVYGWDDANSDWDLLLDTGIYDPGSRVAVCPEYDPLAGPGPDQRVLATNAGVLHVSDDGGQSWSPHAQFSTPISSKAEFAILALTFGQDYHTSGTIALGRAREDKALPTGQEGELWYSHDFGTTFVNALTVPTAIAIMDATPVGPSGKSWLLAGPVLYPDRAAPGGWVGVLRSSDGGVTWSDDGNYQDFFLRSPDWTVLGTWFLSQGFGVSPSFATDGKIFYGRSSNMFRSDDEGSHWVSVRTRQSDFARNLGAAIEPNGDLVAFGATYGSGTIQVNVTQGTKDILYRNPLAYQRSIQVSPNFASDGAVIAGGGQGIFAWFDPTKPVNNVFGVQGWIGGAGETSGTREVAISPYYHANGSDRSIYWSARAHLTFFPSMWRTLDGGYNIELIDRDTQGQPIPFLNELAIAKTYNVNSAATRTDVYGGANEGDFYRLNDTAWERLHVFPHEVKDIKVDPTFSRPGNPRVFVALTGEPHLTMVDDEPGNLQVSDLVFPGLEGAITSIELHPDFGNTPVVYASIWGHGVKKVDLSAPSPAWENVGGPYPAAWTSSIKLSPDFLNDKAIVTSSQFGIIAGRDLPNEPWRMNNETVMVDDIDLGWTFYEPQNPANSAPDRPWPWAGVDPKTAYQALNRSILFGRAARYTFFDNSYLEWEGYGKNFDLLTFAGDGMGEITIEVRDYWTNSRITTNTVDLGAVGGPPSSYEVPFSLTRWRPVRIRIGARLGGGEGFALDGMRIAP